MYTKHISLAFAAVAALLAGCSKSPIQESGDGQLANLELSYVGATETKAAIDGTTFPTEGEIGLFLFEDEMAAKSYGDGYENVKYSYNEKKGKWTASPSIKVGSTPGYLYGYYPYGSEAMDIKAIPVESSLNGDDVMYTAKQDAITDKTASQAAITMNHALARVSITVKNNGYTGDAKLSNIKFSGAEVAQVGTLNALDGSIAATKSDVTLGVPAANQAIAAAGTTYECLLVPSGKNDGKQNVALTLTIDGVDKTASLSGDNGVIFAQGTKSNITIKLSNSGISVQTVSVEDWNVVEVGGHKVTVKFADDVTPGDIMFSTYIDGNNVIVRATSFQGNRLVCNVGDNAQCERTLSGDMAEFTISEISSNIDAVLCYVPLLTLTVTSDSNGKVWIGDDKDKTDGQFEQGEQVVIHAAPNNNNFRLFRWNDDNVELDRTITIGTSGSSYFAIFISSDMIPGLFTVNAEKKQVFFTKGNLYYDGTTFNFEANQYDTAPSSDDVRDYNHISHFMWCDNIDDAISKQYDTSWEGQSPFFTEVEGFTVSVFSANQCRTLTTEEWQYLFSFDASEDAGKNYDNDTRRGKYKLGVTVCGQSNCVVLLPDNWTGGAIADSYDYAGWKHMEAAGAVCLPAAGYRNGDPETEDDPEVVESVGTYGYYWAASPIDDSAAYALYFRRGDYVNAAGGAAREGAQSVRLVTDVK